MRPLRHESPFPHIRYGPRSPCGFLFSRLYFAGASRHPLLCYRCNMVSSEPDFGPLAPNSRYAAQMGMAADLSQDLSQRMFEQPQSNSSSVARSVPAPPSRQPMPVAVPHVAPPQRIPRWLVRMELFLRVMLRIYIGLAICYAPWSHTFWDQNPLFAQFPWLSAYAANGAVRGIISGLGFLNLWFAFQDALRHRDG